MSWTEEKVNKLKDLWGKGQTASQIAEIIGGVSRNAVIGKAHRLNLSAKIKTTLISGSGGYPGTLSPVNLFTSSISCVSLKRQVSPPIPAVAKFSTS